MLVFSTQLCELLPLQPSLWFNPPLSCVNKYTVYTYTVCKGGYWVLGLRQINTCLKILFWWRHFALPPMSLIFLRVKTTTAKSLAFSFILFIFIFSTLCSNGSNSCLHAQLRLHTFACMEKVLPWPNSAPSPPPHPAAMLCKVSLIFTVLKA